jgi:hypothetical protein
MKSRNEPSPIRRVSARKYRGLGDVIEQVAKPIARTIDRIAGTDIEHCSGCARRRETLNHAAPFRRRARF